jgi:uncharacterized membrane protein
MEGFFVLLILLAVGCLICGPIALIISIIALNRSRQMYPPPVFRGPRVPPISKEQQICVRPIEEKPAAAPPGAPEREPKEVKAESPPWPKKPVPEDVGPRMPAKPPGDIAAGRKPPFGFSETIKAAKEKSMLEQQIGTKWILIAGIITVVFGAGFFLKYAYDSGWIGPTGRVIIAACAGLVALAVGEVTRRRGYGIVAKGTTALGFALLYLAVFAAHRYYELMTSTPTFILALLITVAAMLYAVAVDEILAAFLSLLGGFLTPVIVSTGQNLPMPLFSYVTILSVGAMLCAYYRKWRAIDWLSFAGTFALYTGWFEKFYRPVIRTATGPPEQMSVALGWLGVFFAIYLVLPVLYQLVKKLKARKEDVFLVLANAAIVFYYLWTILFNSYRVSLAFAAIGLCVAHLLTMAVVVRRCKEDLNLRLALLVIGLFFLTIAVPLYLKMYAVAMAWAVEALILVIIGLRYRSVLTRAAAVVAFILSLGQLANHLPMHTAAFRFVFNPAFGTWCFVAAAAFVGHLIYRKYPQLPQQERQLITQLAYSAGVLVLMAAISMEWWWHCDYNILDNATSREYFLRGMVLVLAFFQLLLLWRPVCPRGPVCQFLAAILAAGGAVFTMVAFTEIYHRRFAIFANLNFGIVMLFVVSLFAAAWLLKRDVQQQEYSRPLAAAFALAAVFVLWVLLTEQIYLYWYCRNRFAEKVPNWRFLAHMYISVMWALYAAMLMTVGFWRKLKLLRYIAIGLFALLLCKVFILDTSTVKSVYRIAAFLATGVTLVAVSYLYQYLRKKGFFETVLAEKNSDN